MKIFVKIEEWLFERPPLESTVICVGLIIIGAVATVSATMAVVKPTTFEARAQACSVQCGTDGTRITTPGEVRSSIAAGSNGFSLSTTGARVDLGAGTSDYLISAGTGNIKMQMHAYSDRHGCECGQ